ncbi:MAG: hypothetical protein AAGA42_14380 [Actinomycetota bacterium]
MGLKEPIPGLRSIHYDARSPAKVSVVVQPGDTLVVSDDVAVQLEKASQQFKPAADAIEPPVEDEQPKKPAKKATARKKAAAKKE